MPCLWRHLGGAVLALAAVPAAGEPGLASARFDRLTPADGLSHAMVWSVAQDAYGFLWFATSQGLNRYDGYGFEVYKHDPEDPGSLSGSDVSEVFVDRRGVMWVGTRGAGLNRYRKVDETFERLRHDPGDAASLSDDVVTDLCDDAGGRLWAATRSGLNRLDPASGRFTRFFHDPADPGSLAGNHVEAVYEDAAGRLWAGTDSGLDLWDPEGRRFVHHRHDPADPSTLSHDRVFAITDDADGRLWVGTARGLNRLDPASGRFTRFLHDPADPGSLGPARIYGVHAAAGGDVWVATLGGLDRVDRAAGAFVHYRHDPADPWSLSSSSILSLHEDASGILWLGTLGGVNRYVPQFEQFTSYRYRTDRDATLSSNNVLAILEDRGGALWVGTYDNGLDRLDEERRGVTHYGAGDGGPPNATVSALHEDASGALWVGTFEGLGRLDARRRRWTYFRHRPGDPGSLSSDLVLSLLEDRSGRLWIGTSAGVDVRERGRFRRLADDPDPQGPGHDGFYALLEDRAGILWLGSETGGLYRFDPAAGRFEHRRHDPSSSAGLSSDRIAALCEDRDGNLWIGTWDAGLNRLDPGRREVRRYRERDGLASDMVLGILEDGRGRLWMSTGNGLSAFDPRTETFTSYAVDDGLPSHSFSFGSAHRSAGGELLFGSSRGLVAFSPERISQDRHVPPVVVTDFYLFNERAPLRRVDPGSPLSRSILETREIVLSHRDYVFAFEFAALAFARPQRARYAYRLHGFDRDWVETGADKRFAQYSNLSPDDYVFQVRGSNGDGVWNEEGAVIRLRVEPPPWRSAWAYALYALAASAAVWGYARFQSAKLRRERADAERERTINRQLRQADQLKNELIAELEGKNAELERFTYTVSHDLRSPLVTIKGFTGLARRDAADAALLAHDLGRIDEAADRMHRLLDELLELSRIGRQMNPPEKVALADLAREAVELVTGAIRQRGVHVEIAADLPVVSGDRVRLLEVLQNLIENAVKFMGEQAAPRVEVGARRNSDEIVVYVRDNGVGIPPCHHEKVFGLFNRLHPETEGTGVGLALVKRIVEVHGGRIWVESQGRGGSAFCFTLPAG